LKILEEVKIKLFGEAKEALLKRDTKNTKAYHLYLQGRFCYNKASGTAYVVVSVFTENRTPFVSEGTDNNIEIVSIVKFSEPFTILFTCCGLIFNYSANSF
jgi:hypothetical protein